MSYKRIHLETQSLHDFDYFDLLPDSLLLFIFDLVADVKDLGRCCIVSRRFYSLAPLVKNVLIRVDSFIPVHDRPFSLNSPSILDAAGGGSLGDLFRIAFPRIFKPLKVLGQFLRPKPPSSSSSPFDKVLRYIGDETLREVAITPLTQVLKNFTEIQFLKIELPIEELGSEDGNLLKWRADFGSTLDNFMVIFATSMTQSISTPVNNRKVRLRVVLAIISSMAAFSRHYLLEQIILEHKSLDRLILSDVDGQGVLTMNRKQLEEQRFTPLPSSFASMTKLVLKKMRMWYAPQLHLPDGTVMKGVTLVAWAIRLGESKKELCDASWISDAFEEPFGTAAKMLLEQDELLSTLRKRH